MGMWIGRNRKARVTYGFDEIALVPGNVTINPNEVDIAFRLPRRDAEPITLNIPILASAMDGVVDVRIAIMMGELGGLGVLNLGRRSDSLRERRRGRCAEVVSASKDEGHLDHTKILPGTGARGSHCAASRKKSNERA